MIVRRFVIGQNMEEMQFVAESCQIWFALRAHLAREQHSNSYHAVMNLTYCTSVLWTPWSKLCKTTTFWPSNVGKSAAEMSEQCADNIHVLEYAAYCTLFCERHCIWTSSVARVGRLSGRSGRIVLKQHRASRAAITSFQSPWQPNIHRIWLTGTHNLPLLRFVISPQLPCWIGCTFESRKLFVDWLWTESSRLCVQSLRKGGNARFLRSRSLWICFSRTAVTNEKQIKQQKSIWFWLSIE
jgi:hypothetical protein